MTYTYSTKKGFTLAEVPEARQYIRPWSKAFTLAEVLITLAIIGVVAAVTIPALIQNTQDKEFAAAKKTMVAKIEEAMNQMRTQNNLTGFDTPDDFYNEFSKIMKITKRCDSNKLSDCFMHNNISYETESFVVNELTKGSDIVSGDIAANYPADNIGLQFANGTTAIMNYNKNCKWLPPYDKKNVSEAANCISMIFDTNGAKGPNIVGKDIVLYNAHLPIFIDINGIKIFPNDISLEVNVYDDLAAEKACESIGGRIPSYDEMLNLYAWVYDDENLSIMALDNYNVPPEKASIVQANFAKINASNTLCFPFDIFNIFYIGTENSLALVDASGSILKIRCLK